MPGNPIIDQQSLDNSDKLTLCNDMPAPLPSLAAVRAFEAAARLLNFTEAARELGLTQAAVSYQIKLLEERTGATLFDRIGRRIELTPQGQSLASAVIRAFDEMRGGFSALSQDSASVLTVSCSNSFAHLWLAPRIGRFQMRQPHLAVRIHATDTLVDLAPRAHRRGSARQRDSRLGRASTPSCWRPRASHRCAAPLIWPAPARSTARQSCCGPWRLSPQDYWWGQWFAAMAVDEGAAVGPPPILLDSQQMEGRAAIAGQGMAILSPFFWRAEIEPGC